MTKILVFAGSTREKSFNKRLALAAANQAKALGAAVTLVDLRDYPMPLYDGDLEEKEGLPEATVRLKAIMKDHDGWLIACPEYNSSITAVLKNTIDWCSRPAEGETMLAAFTGKVVGLLGASPGALGGMRALRPCALDSRQHRHDRDTQGRRRRPGPRGARRGRLDLGPRPRGASNECGHSTRGDHQQADGCGRIVRPCH